MSEDVRKYRCTIESDGTAQGTKIITGSGEDLCQSAPVKEIVIRFRPDERPEVFLTLLGPDALAVDDSDVHVTREDD